MLRIVLIASLPQEYGPLKRLSSPWRLISRKPFKHFTRTLADKELILVEAGMGRARIQEALPWILAKNTPHLILSFGFAGSLYEAFEVGDVFLGDCFIEKEVPPDSPGSRTSVRGERLVFQASSSLIRFCHDNQVRCARFVTTERPESKLALSRYLGGPPSLVEMETIFTARIALQESIPLLCFRAVSDALEDEIDFDLDAISSPSGNIRLFGVLRTVLREPPLIRSFYDSWKRSRKAGERLAEVLSALVNQPAAELREMALGSHLLVGEGKEMNRS